MTMYVVIFRAKIAVYDEEYAETVKKLRSLAFSDYHCVDFVAASENGYEVALSYWNSLDDITRWRNDEVHRAAQEKGRNRWYAQVKVQIAEISRKYGRID